MKFGWITAFAVLMIACITAVGSFWCFHQYGAHRMDKDGELAWLRQEFELSSQQLHLIEQAHAKYREICEVHCIDILESRQELRVAVDENAPVEQITRLQERVMEIDRECVSSIKSHFDEIAKIMGGEQSRRYLAEVLPRIADFDHEGPVDLELRIEEQHADHLGK
jgi:hypothetical protein